MARIGWRLSIRLHQYSRHFHLWNFLAKFDELANHGKPCIPRQNLIALLTDLRSEETHPDLAYFFSCAPEFRELMQITGPFCHLPRDRAVHNDLVPLDILEDLFVSCRL